MAGQITVVSAERIAEELRKLLSILIVHMASSSSTIWDSCQPSFQNGRQ